MKISIPRLFDRYISLFSQTSLLPALGAIVIAALAWLITPIIFPGIPHLTLKIIILFLLFISVATISSLVHKSLSSQFRLAKKEAQKYKTFHEQLQDIFIELSIDGEIIKINSMAAPILHYGRDELTGFSMERILKNAADLARLLQNLVNNGKLINYELYLQDKEANLHQTLVNATLVRDAYDEPSHIYLYIRDISDKQKTDMRWQESRKMDALATFTTGFHNQFTQYLKKISTETDLLQSNVGPGTSHLHSIQAETERAFTILHHLSAFSQQQDFSPISLDINTCIKDLAGLLDKNISLELDLSPSIPLISADPGQIEQIFINITNNAIFALKNKTASSSKSIVVRTVLRTLDDSFVRDYAAKRKAGDYIMLSISDNGTGMPKDVQEKIFEPFYSTKSYAAGLGLSTVYGIIIQNNGFINVYSEHGHGTTFHIYWPAIAEEKASDSSDYTDLPQGVETVLLIDDNQQFLEYMQSVLTTLGYRVHEFSSGKDALDFYKTKKPRIDLVLTDYIMPAMNGMELLENLYKQGLYAPSILTSGFVHQQVINKEQENEKISFLQKPFTIREFTDLVRKVLDHE